MSNDLETNDKQRGRAINYVRELAEITGQSNVTRDLEELSHQPDVPQDEQAIERRRVATAKALDELEQVISEHNSRQKTEQAAFFGLNSMDDVFVRADQEITKNGATPQQLYGAMLNVYRDVESRRSKLYELLRDVRPDNLDVQGKKIHTRATGLAASIRGFDGPLPGDFEAQREKLAKRLETLSLSNDEKGQLREQVKREGETERAKEREGFKSALESVGMRDFDRLDSFDPHVVALDRDSEKLLIKQFEAARERYLKILDTGGTTAEAEEQLSHIPKTWWPPAFVKEVQAWRVIERQRREAAIKKMFEEESSEKQEGKEQSTVKTIDGAVGKLTTVTGTLAKQSDKLELVGVSKEDAKKVAEILNSVTTAFKTLQVAAPGVDFASEFEEFKEKNSTEKVEQVATAVNEFGEKVESALSAAAKISEAAKEMVEGFIGPVVIASGVAKFVQSCAKMKNIHDSMQSTATLIDKAEIESVLGTREDGGALVKSMENSRNSQKLLIAKAAVETVDASLQIAEGAVDTAGQAHAKYGIVIARKVITLGAKVAFAEVDFRRSRQAMRTLRDAQAGSIVAQTQIFEDSSFYAMSYLAYLVETGDPIADSFARRGLTGADFKKKEISTSILVEVLQKAAGNFDVDQGSETRTEAIGKVVKSGYESAKEKLTEFSDRYFPGELPGSAGTEYDPNWKHQPADVVLAEGYWLGARKQAIDEAGLFEHDEHLPADFGAAATAFQSLGITDPSQFTAKGLLDALSSTTDQSPAKKKETVLKALDKLDACRQGIMAYDAWHTPSGPKQASGPHQGFVAYQTALVLEINRCESALNAKLDEPNWLVGSAARDFSWQPPRSVSLDAASFQRLWSDACRPAWIDDDPPGGVVSALNEVSGAALARTGRETKSTKDARQANKNYFDALMSLAGAIDKVWSECQHPGLKEYLVAIKLEAAKKAREMDKLLSEPKNFAIKNPAFTANAWHETYADAREKGAADSIGDTAKELSASLTAWAKAEALMSGGKPEDQIRGRSDGLTALKDVNKHAVAAGLAIGSPIMVQHCASLAETAKQKLINLDRQNNGATFDWDKNKFFTAEGFPVAYQAAVQGGVVVATNSLRDGITKAIANFERRTTNLTAKDVTPKLRRKEAAEAFKAIEAVDGAIRTMLDDRGHRNESFQRMLTSLQERFQSFGNSGFLVTVLNGAKGGEFKPKKPTGLDLLNWSSDQNSAKMLAVEAGILENADDETFDLAISKAHTYNNLFNLQSTAPNVSPKEMIETKRLARESLGELKKQAQSQQSAVDHPQYREYMQAWIDLVDERLKRLSERPEMKDVGEFDPPPFAYSDDNWQKAKAQAVGQGILEDVRTNVGKFLTESAAAYDEYDKLRNQDQAPAPEQLETARKQAMSKIRQAMASVSKVRKLSKVKHEKWEKYLNQATQAIQKRYDECVRTTSAFATFDISLPRQPTLLDWDRAQELAVKAGLLANTKDQTLGLAISDANTKSELFLGMCDAIGVSRVEARRAHGEAQQALGTLRTSITSEAKKSPDVGFQKYLGEWTEYANRRAELLDTRLKANFD